MGRDLVVLSGIFPEARLLAFPRITQDNPSQAVKTIGAS
jgi:hypothetical protein